MWMDVRLVPAWQSEPMHDSAIVVRWNCSCETVPWQVAQPSRPSR